jgi:hypothetical protein
MLNVTALVDGVVDRRINPYLIHTNRYGVGPLTAALQTLRLQMGWFFLFTLAALGGLLALSLIAWFLR